MPRSLLRLIAGVGASLLLAASLVVATARMQGATGRIGAVLVALTPWSTIGFAAALGTFLVLLATAHVGARTPHSVAMAVAMVGLFANVTWLGPTLVPNGGGPIAAAAHGPSTGGRIRVLTLNLHLGRASASEVSALLSERRPDVVVLEELTPSLWRHLSPGLDRFPHRVGRAAPGDGATMLLSRWRLGRPTRVPVLYDGWRARVRAPRPFTLVGVHAATPFDTDHRWRRDQATLLAVARSVDGPIVMAGDLNATRDHLPFRELLGVGLRDAAEQAGSGWQPTWPVDESVVGLPLPSVAALDHVLVGGGLGVRTTDTFVVRGSDHRALEADVLWR